MEIKDLEIRLCGEDTLAEVLNLEAEVLEQLERPDLLRRNTVSMWHTCLLPPHVCLGAWAGDTLVALAVLYVPQEGDPEALAPLLQTFRAEGHQSAHFKICLVHPKWRGHHLQILLGEKLHAEARQRGFDLLCATTSPHNTASIKNLHRLGYQADHMMRKYGFERIIFYYSN